MCPSLSLTGFSISVVEDDSVQQLYITDVKAGGLAFAKGSLLLFSASLASLSLLPHALCARLCVSADTLGSVMGVIAVAVLRYIILALRALWGFSEA